MAKQSMQLYLFIEPLQPKKKRGRKPRKMKENCLDKSKENTQTLNKMTMTLSMKLLNLKSQIRDVELIMK